MTARATLGLHRHVLVDKWPLLVWVTLEADGIAAWEGPHLTKSGSPVHVVAVAAPNQAFVHAVVIRLGKVGFGCYVASVAEFRRLPD
jgi:hypothetical protein